MVNFEQQRERENNDRPMEKRREVLGQGMESGESDVKKVSEGCANCYAEAWRGFPEGCRTADGLLSPTRGRRPKRKPKNRRSYFVGNMTDLFGEWNTATNIIDWTFETYPVRKSVPDKAGGKAGETCAEAGFT